MAKKKNDQGFIADLLSKLKASYMDEGKKPSRKETREESTGDDAFQAQLRQMLNRSAPAEEPKTKQERKKKTPAPKVEEPAVAEEPVVEAEPIIEEPVIAEEPVIEEPAPTPPKPKKPRKPKEKSLPPPEPVPETVAEEATVAAPAVEEAIAEEAIAEEPVVEEAIAEASVAPEPVTEAPVIEEPDDEGPEEVPAIQYTPVVDLEEIAGIAPVEGQMSIRLSEEEPTPAKAAQPVNDPSTLQGTPIVIRPTGGKTASRRIVIAPPASKKQTVAPVPQVQNEVRPPNTPIRIGKEASAPMSTPTKKQEETAAQKAAPSVKQISIKPPVASPKAEQKKTSAPDKKETPPAAAQKNVPAEKKKTAPPHPRILTKKKAPAARAVKAAPISDKLDQALENDLSSTLLGKGENRHIVLDPHSEVPLVKQIEDATGLDENDLHMLFTMGYESELSSLLGARNLTYLKSEFLKGEEETNNKLRSPIFGYRGREYTGEGNATVIAAHSKDAKKLAWRSIFTAITTFLLLFADNPLLLGKYAEQLVAVSTFLLPLCAMFLLLAAFALSFREIKQGIYGFFSFAPTRYSPLAVLGIAVLLYNIVSLFFPVLQISLPVNLLTSVLLFCTVLCDLLSWSNQMRSFRILSAPGRKTVLERTGGYKRKMRLDDRIVQILNDSEGKNLYRVTQTESVCGFFRRSGDQTVAARPMNILITLSLCLSVGGAFATAVYTKADMTLTAQAFLSLLLLTTPVTAVFSLIYPLFCANRVLSQYRCSLVGDESAEEYSRQKTLIFEDTDLFSTEKCSEINLTEGADLWQDMRLASALFLKIGHTLSPVVSASDAQSIPVKLLRISENGIEATVDNRHVLAGDERFLNRADIDIPDDCRERAKRRTENVGSMYVAIDGILKLSYEIEYTARPSFERVIESLALCDTEVAIRSYDPNISQAFVEGMRSPKSTPVFVLKPVHARDNEDVPLVDSGAVSLEDPEKIVSVVHSASVIKKTRRVLLRLLVIASILAVLGIGTLVFFGKLSLMVAPWILLWHGAWAVICLIATHAEVNAEKLRLLK